MKEQAFASIEKAEAEKVVVLEGGDRDDDDIPDKSEYRPAAIAASGRLSSPESTVAVHVLDVGVKRGIGMMEQIAMQMTRRTPMPNRFVDCALFEMSGAAAKEPQLGIGVVAAVPNPAAEEEVSARKKVRVAIRLSSEQIMDFRHQFHAHFFIGIEREHPVPRAFGDGGIFLSTETLPFLDEKLRAAFPSDLRCAVRRTTIDDYDLIGPAHAGERACEIGFLILRDDGDRKGQVHDGGCQGKGASFSLPALAEV